MSDGRDVEEAPTSDQKERLEDWLTELTLICRKYQVLLLDPEEALEMVDMSTGHLIGLGLALFSSPTDDHHVLGIVAVDSILDGAWIVEGDDGPVEQRHIGPVYPVRDPSG